jgi:ubiquinone/menaquinone biosynthesis C-methylase UbiE
MTVGTEWDSIAQSFDRARKRPWQEILDFLASRTGKGLVIACGNGRHMQPMAQNCEVVIGVDKSAKMAQITIEHLVAEGVTNASVVVGTATGLPFPSESFDCLLFIAGLHNIKGRANRVRALKEVNRVLSKKGESLISVWARWQDRFRLPMICRALLFWKTSGDTTVPWALDGLQIMRFYHLYTLGELLDDLQTAGLALVRVWSVKKASRHHFDNHFVVVKKGPV